MQTLKSLIFLEKTAVKYRNLQISKNAKHHYKQNFSNSLQGYVHMFEEYKNNSAVSRSGLLFGLDHKYFLTSDFF